MKTNVINLAEYCKDVNNFKKLRIRRAIKTGSDESLYDHVNNVLQYTRDALIVKAYKEEMKKTKKQVI